MGRRMSSGLARIPVEVLEMEIRRRAGGVRRLMKRRAKLQTRLDQIDDMIRAAGGDVGGGRGGGGRGGRGRRAGGGGRRPRNEMSLEESLAKVLSGKTMS